MKKLLSILALLITMTIGAIAQTGPKIEFSEMSHSFGKIEEGPEYKKEFSFKNIGTAPLIINNVAASCGCTIPDWTKEPIMPGQSGKIVAVYNSTGRMGGFDKTLTVQTNMGAGADVYLTIKGEVVEKGAVGPAKATEVKKEEPKPATVVPMKKKTKKSKAKKIKA